MTKTWDIWEQTFQRIMRKKKPHHKWTLKVDRKLSIRSQQQGWKRYQHLAFARFHCSLCGRSWVSAKVVVLFQMQLQIPYGQVKMRIFTQRCRKCKMAVFEEPEFSQEGIKRVLNCLVIRILLKCYHENVDQECEIKATSRDPLREVALFGPHDSANCEACLLGVSCPSRSDSKNCPSRSDSKNLNLQCVVPMPGHQPLLRPTSNQVISFSSQIQPGTSKKRRQILLTLFIVIIFLLVILMVTLHLTGIF